MNIVQLTFNNAELAVKLASAVANNANVTLMVPGNIENDFESHLHPSINFMPYHKPRLRQPLEQLRFVYKLWKQIRKADPDVLHIQIGHLWFNAALPFLRKYPLVTTVHDPRDHVGDAHSRKTPQFIKDYGYKNSHRLIVHSNEMKPMLADIVGIPEEKISVVPLLDFGDSTLAQEVPEEKNTVLFFGRIWEYKGLDYLIRAEPMITEQIPDVKIVIAGTGENFDRYRRLMQNPERFVVHNEYISSDFQARLFRQASVIVLPYIEATQSGVIPAAYNFSKPVVATKVGALHEQVDNEHSGFLVEPRNEQELADRIIKLLQNDELRQQMGRNGKLKLETEWSPTVVAQKTIDVYERAINAKYGKNRQLHNSANQSVGEV